MKLNKKQILEKIISVKETKKTNEHYIEIEVLKIDGTPSLVFIINNDNEVIDAPSFFNKKVLTWNFAKSLLNK